MNLSRFKLPSLLLLAAGLALANPDIRVMSGSDAKSGLVSEGGISGEAPSPDLVRERLLRVENNAREIQNKFPLQNIPEAVPVLQNLHSLLAQAHEALAAGNYAAVMLLCNRSEAQISVLHNLGSLKLMNQENLNSPHKGEPGEDSSLLIEQRKARAQWDLQRTTERFELLAQRLQETKSPNAAQLMDKVRSLLGYAKQELALDHPLAVRTILNQIEGLLPELGRLTEQTSDLDKHGLSASLQDSYKNLQPAARAALVQATEIYNRVHDRLSRLHDQGESRDDSKSSEQLVRIQELLDKCREALASGQAQASTELGLKAEALLTEWHQAKEKTGIDPLRQSATSLERLKIKLDRASQIVKASGNEKAIRILEKGLEHFDRAEHGQADGQPARVQVEMDIALKLAAKAIDIARSGQAR